MKNPRFVNIHFTKKADRIVENEKKLKPPDFIRLSGLIHRFFPFYPQRVDKLWITVVLRSGKQRVRSHRISVFPVSAGSAACGHV